MTYSEQQYNALLAVCRSYKNDCDNAFERLKAQQREINALQKENANLTVENEVLQSEKENLMRTLEEGREEIKFARKETVEKILTAMRTMIINRRADEGRGLNCIYSEYKPERLLDDISDYVRVVLGVEVRE